MNAYAISVLLLTVFAAVGAKNEEALKKGAECVKSINWSKDKFEASCNNPGVADGPDRSDFLKMNKCIWLAAGTLDANGGVHPENARNVVKPESGDAAVAAVTKCDPKDNTMSVDAKAEYLYKCTRTADEARYTRNCLAFSQIVFGQS